MEIKGIVITQSPYIKKILKKFNREDCSPVSTPMDPVENFKPNTRKLVDQLEYSRVIGCLMYVMTSTRLDIAYVVGRLSRFTSNPNRRNWKAITRVFKYLRGTKDYGLSYVGYPSVLEEWLRNLIYEIPIWSKPIVPLSIRCDSVPMMAKAYSQVFNGKSRHLGCWAVLRLPDPKRKTLSEKGIDCIFVGYAEHSNAYRFYVIETNESVSINSIIELRDAIFDENRFSSIPRPKDIIPNVQEPQMDDHIDDVPSEISEPRKGKRVRKAKSYGSDLQLYLVEGSRDQVGLQYSYCYSIEEDPGTYNEAMLVPSCFVIFDLEPLSLSFDFVFCSKIFKSLSFRLDRLCHLAILCLDQHAHTLHHLESFLIISPEA
ncbi:zinc finger, CCHC-type containing protein [Tanacetum coccineum]|uniref:Zinc finger, CCHC-type containing protein n=1 Tax=Tanacetum coccineum TaxID=301880 RepID=A0ABQ5IBI6_9ASTR